MGAFRKLAVASATGIVLPIILGGVVRATGSGDACPDWPKCFGRWIPPADYHAILEYSHRLFAALAGILLLALAVSLLKDTNLRRKPTLIVPAVMAFVLLVLQSYLGKLVVERSLSPLLVTVHLAIALLLAATVTIAAVNSFYAESGAARNRAPATDDAVVDEIAREEATSPSPASLPTVLALVSAASVLAVVLIGAYMRAEGASLAFSDWPLMDGRLIPPMTTEAQRIHFAHRLLVLLGAVPLIWLSIRTAVRRPRIRGVVAFAHLATSLYAAQTVVGAMTVLTNLSQWTRATHVALAALTFLASVACAAVCLNEASSIRSASLESREPVAA